MNRLQRIVCALTLCGASLGHAEELTLAKYREILVTYRDGRFAVAADQLLAFELASVSLRNDELPAVLDLERPSERRDLLAAVVLHAEAALRSIGGSAVGSGDTVRRNFYLDEAVALSSALGRGEGIVLTRDIHLAVAYSLFRRYRVVDALAVLDPVAERFPEDAAVQYAFGNLAELSGFIEGSERKLIRARAAYESVLARNPNHARARMRLGRVLVLRSEPEAGTRHLEASLETLVDPAHRTIALLSLGDAARSSGRLEDASGLYVRALREDPQCQSAAVALSHTLRQLGDGAGAQDVISKSMENVERFAPPDSWLAYRLGDSSRAKELWDELRSGIRRIRRNK